MQPTSNAVNPGGGYIYRTFTMRVASVRMSRDAFTLGIFTVLFIFTDLGGYTPSSLRSNVSIIYRLLGLYFMVYI